MNRSVNVKAYIGKLNECLKAKDDFKGINYYRNAEGKEYAVMQDIIGQTLMMDITDYSEAEILRCVSEVVCEAIPANLITDNEERLKIARLF